MLLEAVLLFRPILLFTAGCLLPAVFNLAGAEGFEPPSSVLETDSLAVELTPLKADDRLQMTGDSFQCPEGAL